MKTLLPVLAVAIAVPAAAQRLPDFHYTDFGALRAAPASVELPAPPRLDAGAPAAGPDVITAAHMLVQAGRSVLVGYADTSAQADEAVAAWSLALRAAGIEPGASEFKNGMFTLAYKTSDGRVLRGFLGEPLGFPPKDEAALRADMAAKQAALASAGLTPVAARVVNLDFMLPTYSLLYLAEPESAPELESQLRVLKTGDDHDAGVFAAAGLTIVQQPKPWLTIYIGPQAGYVSMAAGTRQRADEKLKARREFLVSRGQRILAERVTHVDMGDYQYLVEVYFVAQSAAVEDLAMAGGFCWFKTIDIAKDQCVYRCSGGREHRSPVRHSEPGEGAVIACPQVVVPF